MENKLEMRKLGGQDTFLMLKIMSKTGAKNAIKEFLKKQGSFGKDKKSEEDYKSIGIEVMLDVADTIMCNLDDAQSDINKLLANLCDVKVKEIEKLDFMEYNTLIINFFKKEELKSFFKLIFLSFK
ncbi:hypothetical protein [Clostridium botulinum]|uniref:Uncharacterized protein n=1 Tax=Clostridium botulinum TaxID=1491 RepID=A0A9Q1UY71_CLOBO|nr:hypothetical protein [Clostridium botulinum]AEB75902.1 hypothetical protein CbC4_1222 [Clostridium botulinum BKT015925]KEH97214.1 hypothetical protein Z953_02675 [Clostridium botulinum D str. 16868]KEI04676.1 hypothetical protein Y848_00475 [Clostridium botulinum C/D str. Sp77]KLU76773.1 hypothetical protein CBC3_01900 [Clostridium botulinum V891]KOA75200.1 hypothetical protein ADU78_08410 [Clostridium botulinum]